MAPRHHQLMICFLVLVSTTSTAAASTYSDACPTVTPAADRHTDADDTLSLARHFQISGHFFGGGSREDSDDDQLHNSYSPFSLVPHRAARTSDPALVHLAATLELIGPRIHRRGRNHTTNAPVSFFLDGYYSSASLKLCMVATPSATTTGLGLGLGADVVVLRLRVPSPPKLTDAFVTGTLEGSSDLGAIHLLAYADGNDYEFGDSGRAATCSPTATPPLQALSVGGDLWACVHQRDQLMNSYRLVAQDVHHGGGGAPGMLPRWMRVDQMRCTMDGAVRAYVVFDPQWRGNGSFMVGEEGAVAEGHWDTTRGMLYLRACRVRVVRVPSSVLPVGECGMRMSFWFPTVWTVRARSVVAGMLWNTSTQAGVAGLLSSVNVISAFSIDDPDGYHQRNLSDVRYEYNETMVVEAKNHYLKIKNEKKKMVEGTFPVVGSGYTYHDFILRYYGTNRGDAFPVSIGSVMMSEDTLAAAVSRNESGVAGAKHGLLSVSYDIHHYSDSRKQQIAAEGVYDTERGILCMVGCSTTDCRILVTVQFASLEGRAMAQERGGTGVISSLRDRTDPLFFEKMNIILYGMYSEQLFDAVSRMDLESIMMVASMTLWCVVVAVQILHSKRNPEVASATLVTMLAVLAMGYLAPLALHFEVMFAGRRSEYDLANNNNGWLDLNQVMMEVPCLVAMVLHLRLLQLVISGRRRSAADQSKPLVTSSERTVLKVCLPLYLLGAALAMIMHVRTAREMALRHGPAPVTLWQDLVSYTRLQVDGFLLPQIILNASTSGGGCTGVQAISPWFYVGGTVIRKKEGGLHVWHAMVAEMIKVHKYIAKLTEPVFKIHEGSKMLNFGT